MCLSCHTAPTTSCRTLICCSNFSASILRYLLPTTGQPTAPHLAPPHPNPFRNTIAELSVSHVRAQRTVSLCDGRFLLIVPNGCVEWSMCTLRLLEVNGKVWWRVEALFEIKPGSVYLVFRYTFLSLDCTPRAGGWHCALSAAGGAIIPPL